MKPPAALIALLLLAACGADDGPRPPDPGRATASSTCVHTGATTTTWATTIMATPELAKRHLFAAWQASDKAAACQFATDEAVDAMFAFPRDATVPSIAFDFTVLPAGEADCGHCGQGFVVTAVSRGE